MTEAEPDDAFVVSVGGKPDRKASDRAGFCINNSTERSILKLKQLAECRSALVRDWGITEDEAHLILDIIDGNKTLTMLYEEEVIDRETWYTCDRYYYPSERKLALIDAISEGTSGLEYFKPEPNEPPFFICIQTGDTYSPTIGFDSEEQEFLLTTYADLMKQFKQRRAEEL